MLAEVVVVSAVISTVLVTMYIAINRVSSAYETRNSYYDIDALFFAEEINDLIKENFKQIPIPNYYQGTYPPHIKDQAIKQTAITLHHQH